MRRALRAWMGDTGRNDTAWWIFKGLKVLPDVLAGPWHQADRARRQVREAAAVAKTAAQAGTGVQRLAVVAA